VSFSSLITFVRVGRELVFFLSDFSENHFCEQQKKTDKYGLVDGVVRCFFGRFFIFDRSLMMIILLWWRGIGFFGVFG